MAHFLSLHPPHQRGALCIPSSRNLFSSTSNHSWEILKQSLRVRQRFSCLFADNRKQEQARKALESALGGKKSEFDKWNKEIKKREEVGGGVAGAGGGRGGWFRGGGGGGWLGGSNGENFWQEAQQASLALLGVVAIFLLIAKGNVMFAFVFNSLLFVLRGVRNGLEFVTSRVLRRMPRSRPVLNPSHSMGVAEGMKASAKENVVRKWGMD